MDKESDSSVREGFIRRRRKRCSGIC